MLRETAAVVLRTQPLGESNLLLNLYTREYGRVDVLAKGVRKARDTRQQALLQLGAALDVVYYHKDTRDLQQLTSSQLRHAWQRLWQDPAAMVYVYLCLEVWRMAVTTHEADAELFDRLEDLLLTLDRPGGPLFDPFADWLVQVCRHLGFAPDCSLAQAHLPLEWNLNQGWIAPTPNAADPLALATVHLLQGTGKVPGHLRRAWTQRMLEYWQVHVPGFRMPNSLVVWQQLFA